MNVKADELDWLKLNEEDYAFVDDAKECTSPSSVEDNRSAVLHANASSLTDPDPEEVIRALSVVMLLEDPEAFCCFVDENRAEIYEAAIFDEDVTRALLIGYKIGISEGHGASANALGAMYYLGALVEQDYEKAEQLYVLAARWGCGQSIINLGYIYEYGRNGEPDHAKAYECYSLAAALTQKSEALYKLGDMYSRGRAVEKDMAMAIRLWKRSLEQAEGAIELAQPAIRLAPIYLDGSQDCGIEPDALLALNLYQQAELGLRLDIADGQTYYAKRLIEAIEGQSKARRALDACSN